jgi:hypothetical protein
MARAGVYQVARLQLVSPRSSGHYQGGVSAGWFDRHDFPGAPAHNALGWNVGGHGKRAHSKRHRGGTSSWYTMREK